MTMRPPTTTEEEHQIPTDSTRELVEMTDEGGLVRVPLGALPPEGAAHLEDQGVLQVLHTTLLQTTLLVGLHLVEAEGEAGAPPADLRVEEAAEVEVEEEAEVEILMVGSHLPPTMTTDQVTPAYPTTVLPTKSYLRREWMTTTRL